MMAALEDAREMQAAGLLPEAAESYREALRLWMRRQWIAFCKRPGTTIHDPEVLRHKLRACHILDRPTFRQLGPLLIRRSNPSVMQLTLLSAIVEGLIRQTMGGLQ